MAGLYPTVVILDISFQGSVSPSGVEIKGPHLFIDPVIIPVVENVSVDGSDYPRAMATAQAVDIEFAGCGIIRKLQELFDLCVARTFSVTHWNVDVAHSCALGIALLASVAFVSSVPKIAGLLEEHPDALRDGIALRKFGQQIIEWLGGKRIHPAWIVLFAGLAVAACNPRTEPA